MDASSGPHGDLHAYVQRHDGLYVNQGLTGDISRLTRGVDTALNVFKTALHGLHLDFEGARKHAELLDKGASHAEAHALIPPENVKGSYHLGSGTITYGGMNMLANDPTWISAATPFSTLSSMLYVASGTSSVAAAATDYGIATLVTNSQITGGTNGYTTGVITNGGNGSTNTWKNTCTVAYNASLNIYEYGLFMSNGAAVTGTPSANLFGSRAAAGQHSTCVKIATARHKEVSASAAAPPSNHLAEVTGALQHRHLAERAFRQVTKLWQCRPQWLPG